jgi:hypothetical protein
MGRRAKPITEDRENLVTSFDQGYTTALMVLDNWIRANVKDCVVKDSIRQELLSMISDSRPHGTYPPEVWEVRNVEA